MIAERKTSRRIFSIIVAFMLVFTTVMVSTVTVDAKTVKPKSITLKATSKTVDIKGKVEVSVKSVKPATASKNVIWKSSDKKIATVSSKGVVTGKAPGKVIITATSKANKKVKETINLTVKQITPTKVALNKKKANLAVGGDKLKLKATVKPAGVYNKGVTWKSSKPAVAKVSKTGVVTPLKAGVTEITVTTKEKKKTAKCLVVVTNGAADPVIPIPLGLKEFSLNMGTFAQLPASEGAAYKSSNEVIAVVNKDGLVTPKAAGKVKITSGSNSWKITVSDASLLNNWVMTGYYKDALINNTKIGANAAAFVWDNDAGKFVAAEKSADTVLGSYVQLTDQTGDKAADVILAVKYEDGAKFWNGETTWVNGAGEGREPNVLSDKEWAAMFAEKQRIPMGERLLANWGLGDWSGTTDWAEYVDESGDSPYWTNTHIDWSKVNSTDTLIMLTGFKTQLQETGSTCVMNSAISVLDWYGVRGDLNSRDLSSLRDEDRAGGVGGTSLDELENVFEKLGELGLTGKWAMEGYNDNGGKSLDSEWLQSELKKGHPVIVIWNSWGPHGQVIIGYDNLGTENTADDMLIMMDPYDSTDHNNDGYITQSYERLRDGWLTWTNKNTDEVEMTGTKYLSVWPADEVEGEYAPKNIPAGEAAIIKNDNVSDFSDAGKIPYGNTAADLKEFYPEVEPRYGTPYHGAASKERWADFNYSPYYVMLDAYGTEAEVQKRLGSSTLSILDNFATIQQATQWTCGVTCSLMTIEYFGMNEQRIDENGNKMVDAEGNPIYETDISLCTHRQGGKRGATYRDGMQEIFDYMESEYNQDWITITDMDFDKLAKGYGSHDVLVPYLIKNEIPVMAGWDEWGGHWQAAIGYDDMGTEATQDDVLIMADPYDTTDHNQNGYLLESYERLVYGWYSCFEDWNYETDKYINEPGADNYGSMFVAIPNTPEYADVIKTLGLN